MPPRTIRRRDFLRSGIVAAGAMVLGPGLWRGVLATPAQPAPSPYGSLMPADLNGFQLPAGFTSRLVALSRLPVLPTLHAWHQYPDGGATFPTPDGGWVLVSNSEVSSGGGGVGAIRFAPDGGVTDAYTICAGTSSNCSGGPTPWSTWLTCEETNGGGVWECDPFGDRPAVALEALGRFKHEAAAVDPVHGHVYMTEDTGDGRFYRFVPDAYPNLSAGRLEVAEVADLAQVTSGGPSSAVAWRELPDASGTTSPTRTQVASSTPFDGGEGTWYDEGSVYFTTKGDNRVWVYDCAAATLELLYDDNLATDAILTGVDNVTVSATSGDVFVAEDGGDLDIVMITPEGGVARLLKASGPMHVASELAGPCFDPSGSRFYLSSQRAFRVGATYEITGPFRHTR